MLPSDTWGRSCPSPQRRVNTTTVQAAFHSVTYLFRYIQTLGIWGTAFLLLAGDRAVPPPQCSSLLQHEVGCIGPEDKRNQEKMADAKTPNQGQCNSDRSSWLSSGTCLTARRAITPPLHLLTRQSREKPGCPAGWSCSCLGSKYVERHFFLL